MVAKSLHSSLKKNISYSAVLEVYLRFCHSKWSSSLVTTCCPTTQSHSLHVAYFWSDAMLSVNLLVLLNEVTRHDTPVSSSKPSPHLFYLSVLFLWEMTCLFVSTRTPHSLSTPVPRNPGGRPPMRSLGGMSESLCDCVFALYSTISGDHIHGYSNGTLILFYYKLRVKGCSQACGHSNFTPFWGVCWFWGLY